MLKVVINVKCNYMAFLSLSLSLSHTHTHTHTQCEQLKFHTLASLLVCSYLLSLFSHEMCCKYIALAGSLIIYRILIFHLLRGYIGYALISSYETNCKM